MPILLHPFSKISESNLYLELLPSRHDLIQEEVSRGLAGVGNVSVDAQGVLELLDLLQQLQPLGQDVVDAAVAAEVLFRLKSLFSVT